MSDQDALIRSLRELIKDWRKRDTPYSDFDDAADELAAVLNRHAPPPEEAAK